MLLSSALDQVRFEVDSILRKEFGSQLFTVSPDNNLRLLKLRVWSVRYQVPVRYILTRLIPHYKRFATSFRRKYVSDKGIGVTIPVLTGKAAEQQLKVFIAKDFPDGENAIAWKEAEIDRCLAIIDRDEIQGKPKAFLHHKTVKSFVDAYETRINAMRNDQRKLEKKMSKQPWRDNPWV